jgi:hypothetical protein
MTTNTSKDMVENVTLDAVLTADEAVSTSSDESSIDSNNESGNESAIEEEALSDEFDSLRWSILEDISNIQVYEDSSNKHTSKLSPFHGQPSMVTPSQEHHLWNLLFTSLLPILKLCAI